MEPLRVKVETAHAGARLDAFLAAASGLSRNEAAALVVSGAVRVDGTIRTKAYRVSPGETIEAVSADVIEAQVAPPDVPIVFEDDHILVVDKPAGVVVHPAAGVRSGTLVDGLRAAGRPLAPAAGPERPGIVHRLDRDVSGLLVVAKTDQAYTTLVAAMAQRRIERIYLALVVGIPPTDRGTIDAPVARDPKHRTRMSAQADGKPSVTHFRVLERYEQRAALLEVRLETGRTHQIRTHLEAIGYPIAGDAAYGRDRRLAAELRLERPFLHAWRLRFEHPVGGEQVDVTAELPGPLRDALGRLT
jgi:23S rRNA pseudouridine1911/1915/1917 synthase